MQKFLLTIVLVGFVVVTMGAYFYYSVPTHLRHDYGEDASFNNVFEYYRIFEGMNLIGGDQSQLVLDETQEGILEAEASILPDEIGFILDQSGFVQSQEPDNLYVGKVEMATGVELRLGVMVKKERNIDPARIKVTLTNEKQEETVLGILQEEKDYGIEYVAKFVPSKEGKYVAIVKVQDTPYRGTSEISVFDHSLMKEMNIENEDFSMDLKLIQALPSDPWTVTTVVKPYIITALTDGAPWDIDLPGHLYFATEGKDPERQRELEVYRLVQPEKYMDKSTVPYFYKHILALSNFLQKKEVDSKNQYEILSFPPINASLRGVSHIEFLESNDFSGVSYIYGGFFQAYDPAQQPTYSYQGLSRDGKYFVRFTHALESTELKEYMEKKNNCSSTESESDDEYAACVEESFRVLEQSNSFLPTLKNLNDFVKSFQLKEEGV